MFSKIFLCKDNLIENVKNLKSICNAEICAMVKANAYGHGVKEITEILKDYVEFFGVSNQSEAGEIRERNLDSKIIVFGACEDYLYCMKYNISFALFSYFDAKNIIKIAKKENLTPKMHLCVNSGMNRYGVKEIKEFVKIIKLLEKNKIELEGIYTHFSSLTTDENYTQKQKETFEKFLSLLPQNWKTIKHVGGGGTIYRNFCYDMYRTGLEIYGYGNENLKRVLSIESHIVDLQKVKKGEHIGYLCSFTAPKDMTIATIPLGYGDGFPRKLSNKFGVIINGKKAINTGNICMDAFMVDVTDIRCKVGDKVKILDNATDLTQDLQTTEYEVLTNFTKFRGERLIY